MTCARSRRSSCSVPRRARLAAALRALPWPLLALQRASGARRAVCSDDLAAVRFSNGSTGEPLRTATGADRPGSEVRQVPWRFDSDSRQPGPNGSQGQEAQGRRDIAVGQEPRHRARDPGPGSTTPLEGHQAHPGPDLGRRAGPTAPGRSAGHHRGPRRASPGVRCPPDRGPCVSPGPAPRRPRRPGPTPPGSGTGSDPRCSPGEAPPGPGPQSRAGRPGLLRPPLGALLQRRTAPPGRASRSGPNPRPGPW